MLSTDLPNALKCGSVYNVLETGQDLVCDTIMTHFHALWVSLGWAAACLPIAGVAQILLSKYYRRFD